MVVSWRPNGIAPLDTMIGDFSPTDVAYLVHLWRSICKVHNALSSRL